jgi:hypothetical protein
MCTNEIPADKKWDAICCSPECTKARKQYGRSRKDQTACRYCLKPSTPEERARFNLWQKWEAEMIDSDPELAATVKAKWEAKAQSDPILAGKVLDRALMKEVQALRMRLNLAPKGEEPNEPEEGVGTVSNEEEA